jgi:L-threonylcarbamoyladenylate synthase
MTHPSEPQAIDVAAAVALLRAGGVIAYPTEAVWGLGCDPMDEAAVLRLLDMKQREVAKGLILVVAASSQLDGLVDWGTLAPGRREAVVQSWPGPHTWIVPATPRVPRWVTGDHAGVAVRVSAHPTVSALCRGFGRALVSTSANPAGAPPPRSVDAIDHGLRALLDAVVAGETSGLARPTPIRDAATGVALRD